MSIFQPRAGQSIIEVIIATGVVALVMTAIVAAITVSVKNTALANQKLAGTKYAQEGMEFFRQQRSVMGWSAFSQRIKDVSLNTPNICLATLPASLTEIQSGDCEADQFVDQRQIFTRHAEATFDENKQGKVLSVNITVVVEWDDGTLHKSTQTTQDFLEYTNTDAPKTVITNQVTADASSVSAPHSADLAVDGDPNTFWSASGGPTQWIHLDLKQKKTISTINLRVAQSPSGPTHHDVYAGPDWAGRVLVKSFGSPTTVTSDGDQLTATFDPPLTNVQHVWVFTTTSPSWVAWYEVQAY